jgi:hypothetical protein
MRLGPAKSAFVQVGWSNGPINLHIAYPCEARQGLNLMYWLRKAVTLERFLYEPWMIGPSCGCRDIDILCLP